MADVRAEVAKTVQSTQSANKSELSMRQQLAAVSSLQRQRSAALITEWKRTEKAAADLARGVGPVKDNLQKVTDIMQTLGSASATLQGPMGGVASRLRSLGAVANEAGGGLGLAGAGIAGLIAAVAFAETAGPIILTKQFLDLTNQVAEFQGKMFDLSQQTGVNVETLSALEIVAKTTGGDIESITASLGIFQKNLEAAQDPTTKQAEALKELGIQTDNTEQALRQTLTRLAAMPEGFKQTATALELFGRGGKQILAILKEMGGDLDGAIEKFRAMGVLITTEEAKAADEYNDQLALLQFQIRALTATLVKESIPLILSAVKEVSQAIKENHEVIEALGVVASGFARGTTAILIGSLRATQTALNGLRDAWFAVKAVLAGVVVGRIDIIMTIYRALKGQQETLSALGQASGSADAESMFGGVGGGFAEHDTKQKGAKKTRSTELQDALKEADLAAQEIRLRLDADVAENKRALDREARDIEEFTKRAIDLADQKLNAIIDRVNAEQQVLDRSLAKKLIKQKDHENRTRELTIETQQAVQQNEDELSKLEDDRDKQIAAAQLAAGQRRVQMQEDADARVIASIQDRVSQNTLLESEAQKQIAVIVQEAFARRKAALEEEQNAYGVSLERRKAITDELIRLEGDRANAVVEASRKIRDALKAETRQRAVEKENQARLQGIDLSRGDEERQRQVTGPFQGSGFDELFSKINENLTGSKQAAAVAGLQALEGAFQGVANAVGDAVEAFVLYGSAGVGLRKFTAELIANIARQAAVQAAWEGAQALAMLALNFFWPDPKYIASAAMHAKAAAAYGIIAVGAALAGRAVAGGSFTSSGGATAGGAFKSATGGGRSNSTTGGSATPIVTGSQRAMQVHITIEHGPTKWVDSHIKNVVVSDAGTGGVVRDAIVKEIKRQE